MPAKPTRLPQHIRVLLIEDNPGDARLIERIIQRADPRYLGAPVTLHHTATLDEGLAFIDHNALDIILLDLGLSRSQGLDTLDQLLRHHSSTPVVILTGLQQEDASFQALQRGAEDFIHKDDLDAPGLSRAISHAINRRQRQLHTDVIEAARQAMVLIDITGDSDHTTLVNSACLQLLGHSLEDWQRDYVDCFTGPLSDSQKIESLLDDGRQGRRAYAELRAYTGDDAWFWARIDAIPITTSDGHTTHLLLALTDISDRVQWRTKMAEVDRMTTLGLLASGVAHEINNPLAFTTANLRFALRTVSEATPNTDDLEDALEDALIGTDRVRDVIGDLRLLAGPGAGPEAGDDTQPEPLDINTAIQSSVNLVRHHLQSRATLEFEPRPVSPVFANRSKLSQVFLNLLINAIDAIPLGADPQDHSITVGLREEDSQVIVTITDDGKGISDHALDQLFEPFFSTKEGRENTGLGLPISQHILHLYQGSISVDSQLDVGTTVTVSLPSTPPSKDYSD